LNGYFVRTLAIGASVAILAACSGGSMNQTLPSTTSGTSGAMAPNGGVSNAQAVCAAMQPRGYARCFAWIRTDIKPMQGIQPNVSGYGPTDLQTAYNLPSGSHGTGQTVGIVDAFDNPNAETNLGTYRSNFGLSACTTANGCFKKVDQTGGTSYPPGNHNWGAEISLDLDMASAICPNCHIVLVEAKDNSFANLAIAESQAVTQGAGQISNSYGGSEFSKGNSHYHHTGVVITASSGDGGYGAQQPCSWATVVCVGGTTLTKTSPRTEESWSGAGSGCSSIVPKPTFQTDTGCTMRSESDVSADANPSTGVAVYDTYGYPGWTVFGGTSVASPIIASVFALAGNHTTQHAAKGIWAHGGKPSLNDVTTGIPNGTCPSAYKYICVPGVGYDGVTGWGTPNGLGAF
jgi:subtilase family serine protease